MISIQSILNAERQQGRREYQLLTLYVCFNETIEPRSIDYEDVLTTRLYARRYSKIRMAHLKLTEQLKNYANRIN